MLDEINQISTFFNASAKYLNIVLQKKCLRAVVQRWREEMTPLELDVSIRAML